jgi:hypothetical protein
MLMLETRTMSKSGTERKEAKEILTEEEACTQ